MSKRSIVFGLVVACALTGASGNPRVLVTLWRGEKAYVRVPDKMEKAITDEEFGKIVKMFDREKAQEGKQDWEAIHKGVDDFIFNLTKSWANLRPKHSHLRLCAESRKSSFDRMK